MELWKQLWVEDEKWMSYQEGATDGKIEGKIEERQESIQNLITACQSLGAAKDYIIQQLVTLYHLSMKEATEKVNTIMQ